MDQTWNTLSYSYRQDDAAQIRLIHTKYIPIMNPALIKFTFVWMDPLLYCFLKNQKKNFFEMVQ